MPPEPMREKLAEMLRKYKDQFTHIHGISYHNCKNLRQWHCTTCQGQMRSPWVYPDEVPLTIKSDLNHPRTCPVCRFELNKK